MQADICFACFFCDRPVTSKSDGDRAYRVRGLIFHQKRNLCPEISIRSILQKLSLKNHAALALGLKENSSTDYRQNNI